MILFVAIVAVWGIWLIGSTRCLVRLNVLNPRGWNAAPLRRSQFTLVHVGMVVGLYVCLSMVLQSALSGGGGGGDPSGHATAPAPAARASAPATLAVEAPTTAASQPGETALNRMARTNPDAFAVRQALDSLVRLTIVLLIILAARTAMETGCPGFGLSIRGLGPALRAGGVGILTLVPWLFSVYFITGFLSFYLRHGVQPPAHPVLEALGAHPTLFNTIVLIIVPIVLAPFVEEVIFRGLLQTALLNTFWPPPRSGPDGRALPPPASRRWAVILISSALFALIHFNGSNPEVLPVIFTLALWLGYVYERTGNLWACMIVHAAFNTVSTVLFLMSDGPAAKPAAAASLTLWHWFV